MSEGFILNDPGFVIELGTMAAAARTSLYALQLDSTLVRRDQRARATRSVRRSAGAARGARDAGGRGARRPVQRHRHRKALFERIESELSGYYLLGVESDPKDRDGKAASDSRRRPRKGAIVRSRRQLLNTPAERRANRNRRQAAAAALSSPLISSALPLRVASFALQGPERDKVQLLIHADIGNDYPASKVASVGYVISDQNGKVIADTALDMRLLPVMNGVPSALQYTTGASLPPGDYTLKLAVAEGDRVGTVEHVIHAALPTADTLTFSELMVGGPLERRRDCCRRRSATRSRSARSTATSKPTGRVLRRQRGVRNRHRRGRAGAAQRRRAAARRGRDPGDLHERDAGPPAAARQVRAARHRLGRQPIDQDADARLRDRAAQSADDVGGWPRRAGPRRRRALPAGRRSNRCRPAFQREDAVDRETLAPFRERTPPEVKDAFEQGVAFLAAGDYPKAEVAFKTRHPAGGRQHAGAGVSRRVVCRRPATTSRPPARGRPRSSTATTCRRSTNGSAARSCAPTTSRKRARCSRKPRASGRPTCASPSRWRCSTRRSAADGRPCARSNDTSSDRTDDRDAYYVAVQWLYTLHSTGAVVHSRAQDVQLAREYAAAYEQASGPQVPLVKQWIGFLEGEKP